MDKFGDEFKTIMIQNNQETDVAMQRVLNILEQWGSESKFIWFRELHRITDIDKGLLRNIINELKKSKEIKDTHNTNNRILFCLGKHYKKCREVQLRFKDKEIRLKDGSKTRVIHDQSNTAKRTQKRLTKQKNRRLAKSFTKKKRPHKS